MIFKRIIALLKLSSFLRTDGKADFNDTEKFLKFYSPDGQEIVIAREEYRTKVLPYNLREDWSNAEALYNSIKGALLNGFYEDILESSYRLLSIDSNPERSHTMTSIVLMKNGKENEARQLLETYLEKYGQSAIILTNLAKTYKDIEDSEEILWKALQIDPNIESCLDFWLVIQLERQGKEGYKNGLLRAMKLPNAWAPQLYLTREYLKSNNLKEALPFINHVLNTAPLESEALADISGHLGRNGYIKEVIDIILPHYNPQYASLGLLNNILFAYREANDPKNGLSFINKMRNHQELSDPIERVKQHKFNELLLAYENEFKKNSSHIL